MRIMHVIARFHAAGSEEVVATLAAGLAQLGHNCCVVALTTARQIDRAGEDQKRRLATAGVEVVEFSGEHFRRNLLTGIVRLAALWQSWKPDIVHSHTDRPDFTVSFARRLRPVPLARTIHNSRLWHTHWYLGWLTEGGFRDDLVVLISNASLGAYRDVRRRYGLPESRTQVTIPNGIPSIDPDDYADRSALAYRFSAALERVQLCFAGRFTAQKGFDVLLDAMEHLPLETLARIELHAFGQGEERSHCIERARRRKLPIRFHQPVAHMSRLLSAFDVLIVPSRFEGMPLIVLEAFAAGVPVIATRAPGLDELLPPAWPLAVPPEDPSALSQLLIEAASPLFKVGPLREQARTWAKGRFSAEPMVDAYDAAYRNFTAQPNRRDPRAH